MPPKVYPPTRIRFPQVFIATAMKTWMSHHTVDITRVYLAERQGLELREYYAAACGHCQAPACRWCRGRLQMQQVHPLVTDLIGPGS